MAYTYRIDSLDGSKIARYNSDNGTWIHVSPTDQDYLNWVAAGNAAEEFPSQEPIEE
jgi:hypothetical protein